jgi:hypothetical protein
VAAAPQDGAAPISSHIAPAKARDRGAGPPRVEDLRRHDQQRPRVLPDRAGAGTDGMLEGGVPIIVDGHVVGAVGVSGVKSAEDAQIAKAGIAALANLQAFYRCRPERAGGIFFRDPGAGCHCQAGWFCAIIQRFSHHSPLP